MNHLFSSIGVLQRSLNYHLERHNVISSNIANVDTPGFRPRELVRQTEQSEESRLRLDAPSSGQRSDDDRGRESYREFVEVEQVAAPGMDGNAVNLEREMSKLAANDIRFDAATRLVRMHLGLLRYAVNDGRG